MEANGEHIQLEVLQMVFRLTRFHTKSSQLFSAFADHPDHLRIHPRRSIRLYKASPFVRPTAVRCRPCLFTCVIVWSPCPLGHIREKPFYACWPTSFHILAFQWPSDHASPHITSSSTLHLHTCTYSDEGLVHLKRLCTGTNVPRFVNPHCAKRTSASTAEYTMSTIASVRSITDPSWATIASVGSITDGEHGMLSIAAGSLP